MSIAVSQSAAALSSPWPEGNPALIRHYVAGLSPFRIAEAMGLTPGQISGQLFRLGRAGLLPARRQRRREAARARPAACAPAPAAAAPAEAAAAPVEAPAPPTLSPEGVNPRWITPGWRREQIVELWRLWMLGETVAHIGRELGASASKITGKAQRIGLPPRGSPIHRNDPAHPGPPPAPVLHGAGATLPPLAAVPAGPALPEPPAAPRYGRIVTCCWPIGEPGAPGFSFCDAASERGKSYCAEHAQRAFQRCHHPAAAHAA